MSPGPALPAIKYSCTPLQRRCRLTSCQRRAEGGQLSGAGERPPVGRTGAGERPAGPRSPAANSTYSP